jgi:hypothetical protein
VDVKKMMIICFIGCVGTVSKIGQKKTKSTYKEGCMMFTGGLLLSAGATIAVALVDKTLDEAGYQWLGTVLRIVVPVVGMALGVYFLQTNPILRWL